jgi:hypothetical protein
MTKPHRQKYGLGSFIKKAAKKVKKVFKSPLGKAALLAGGAYFAPTLWGGAKGLGGWKTGLGALRNKAFGAALGNMRGAGPLHGVTGGGKPGILGGAWNWMKKNPGQAAFLGAGAGLTGLSYLGGGDEEEEVVDNWPGVGALRKQAQDYYTAAKPDYLGSPFMPPKESVMSGYYGSKDGGIVGLANGGNPAEAQAEQMLKMEYQKYRNQGGTMSYQQFKMAVLQQAQGQGPMAQGQQAPQMAAYGGRMGYQGGELVEDESMVEATPTGMMEENVEEVQGEPTREQLEALAMEIFQLRLEELDEEQLMVVYQAAMEQQPEEMAMQEDIEFNPQMAQGQMAQPQMAAEGGLMSLGGMEKDYRQEGGFVPLGAKEKADDVPARLSKNEFVFTADAVRNAGGGDIDAGAEVMENVMNNLESGGQISEESQGGGEEMISEEEIVEGPDGAQEMYDQQQMLQSRMA